LLQVYGRVRFEESRSSTNHRVVMYRSSSITPDDLHLWQIPVPVSFTKTPGSRELVVALCFDPPTRGRRLDYLASTMQFDILRGVAAEVADQIYRAPTEEDLEQPAEPREGDEPDGADDSGAAAAPRSVAELGRRRLPLQPSANVRRGGANQLARWRFRNRLRPDDGE